MPSVVELFKIGMTVAQGYEAKACIFATTFPRRTNRRRICRNSETLTLILLIMSVACFGEQDLTQLSLEDLANTKVTSVSKKEQNLSQVAAAIFVITQEEIRRSGATNVPDLLRMVPGVDVAQINASSWAISARGFNQQFSDKLLVLIDGRPVYTPLFAGVYWDVQDVVLEDIDRIEVIRGPGATVWGANAVNGVINIINKKSADTQGVLITAGGGIQELGFGTAQYGGKVGTSATYRVFVKGFDHNHSANLPGHNADDSWHLLHTGFRLDDKLSARDNVTIQGDLYGGSEGVEFAHIASIAPPINVNVDGDGNLSGGNVLGRWNHILSSRSDTAVQFFFDGSKRDGPESREDRNTFGIDFQEHFALGSRHDFIWGADYRNTQDHTYGTIDQAWRPASVDLQRSGTFIQDEIVLKPDRVFLTVGAKLEKDYFKGFELTPSVSVAWTPTRKNTLWVALARAARTPDRVSTGAYVNIAAFPGPGDVPTELRLLGNPNQKSEQLSAFDAGYRAQPRSTISMDIAFFYNRYSDLTTNEPGTPFLETGPPSHLVAPLLRANKMHGTTDGVEVSANWKVTNRWTISPGYALLQMRLRTDANSLDTTTAADAEGSSPQHQAQMRSHVNLPGHLVWDLSTYFVSSLPAQQVQSVTRIDTQLSRHLGERWDLSLVGQNLLRDHHLESNDSFTSVNPSQVKRGGYMKITWRFP